MTDSKIQPEVLVCDNNSKVGKVVGEPVTREINGNSVEIVAVDFWGEEQRRPTSLLTPLDSNSPEALLWDRPEQLISWAEEAPLKLVALALSVGGGKGKAADIRGEAVWAGDKRRRLEQLVEKAFQVLGRSARLLPVCQSPQG